MSKTVRPLPNLYDLQEVLGQGANGVVYRAVRSDANGQIQQAVAIKVLGSRKLVEGWRREFESLCKVHSPHCVRVFGFEWLDGRPALILELIEGATLAELRHKFVLGRGEVLCIIEQVARGLKDLADHGMCHGDLSPTNILIDRDGRVRLVDFGFGNSDLGRRHVTPEFAAPEVLKGAVPSLVSDWWSLGKILVWLSGNHAVFLKDMEKLLAVTPGERCWQSRLLSPRQQSRIAQKICLLLAERKGHARTHSLILNDSRLTGWRPFLLALVMVLIAKSSAGQPLPPILPIRVQIRSAFGVELTWNGRPVGFAPLDLEALPPGTHHLQWSAGGVIGNRTLTLRAGDLIVIDDKTFMNH
jgi:serine/threonine protein kinase